MEFTCEVGKSYGISPFEVLKQDKDEVIMLINYFIEKGDTETNSVPSANSKYGKTIGKTERIRVNDKTATGGWY